MPYQAPGTLSAADVYSITAYVLFLNGLVAEQTNLDARSLPHVQMPNRNGFVRGP
jgi:S-disulfanyl-L-cysteine oxidoreductase SoxD